MVLSIPVGLGVRSPLAEVQQNVIVNKSQPQQQLPSPKAAGKSDPSEVPKTAPETQSKNIVTSWAAKADTSTKKKQEQQQQQHPMLPKSASKKPPSPAPPVLQEAGAPTLQEQPIVTPSVEAQPGKLGAPVGLCVCSVTPVVQPHFHNRHMAICKYLSTELNIARLLCSI
jgi:hypothetical protein